MLLKGKEELFTVLEVNFISIFQLKKLKIGPFQDQKIIFKEIFFTINYETVKKSKIGPFQDQKIIFKKKYFAINCEIVKKAQKKTIFHSNC